MNQEIKTLVQKFQRGKLSKREILNRISPLILSIPTKLGNIDDDVKSDFYAFIAGRLERIVSKYKSFDHIAFEAWLAKVLKRQFINYVKFQEKNNFDFQTDCEIEHVPNEQSCFLSDEIRTLDLNFKKFSSTEKNVLKLKYGLLENKESESPEYLEASRQVIKRLEAKKRIENILAFRYVKLLKLQAKKQTETNAEKLSLLKIKEEKLIKSKRILENIYNRKKICSTNKWVGEQLGISEGTVSVYLNRIKNKFQNQGIKRAATYN